jgi:hypothetical protein
VSPVKYELGFYILEDDILHSHRRENVKTHKLIAHSADTGQVKTEDSSEALLVKRMRNGAGSEQDISESHVHCHEQPQALVYRLSN